MHLHIVSKSPMNSNSLELPLCLLLKDSVKNSLLLIDDGVYYLSSPNKLENLKEKNVKIYAIENDIVARGLNIEDDYIELIDYDKFVNLTAENTKSFTW